MKEYAVHSAVHSELIESTTRFHAPRVALEGLCSMYGFLFIEERENNWSMHSLNTPRSLSNDNVTLHDYGCVNTHHLGDFLMSVYV